MAVMTPFISLLEPLTEPAEARLQDLAGPSQEEVQERVRQAEREAQEILARAQAQAQELLDDAGAQAEVLRESAWQEGFHDGQQKARAQVEAELRAQWDAEREAVRQELQALVTHIGEARQALWESQEAEMVHFVLDIARQIIKTEVSQNPEIITGILHNALRRVTDKEHVRIRVSVGDAPHIRAIRDELLSTVDGLKGMEIVDDRRIGDGGCVIETNAGTIDAKIETQIAEVERVLSDVLE